MLKVNDQAPVSVQVMSSKGVPISLDKVMEANPGKSIVLYFYPKDETPGCTTQACNFRDLTDEISKAGAVIIGVSKDDLKSHGKFATKHELPFDLWSDPDHVLMEAFGVWGERAFMGRTYFGTSRSTFVISPDGKIVAVWEKANPATNGAEVLEFLRK